jgi:hypothetical protein
MLESFEDTGEFWLPDAPTNKVGGTLSYSPGGRPTLTLAGSFRTLKEELDQLTQVGPAPSLRIILGRTAEARDITLYGCREAGGTVDLEYGGATEKQMEAFAVFKGVHFETKEGIQFREITVQLSHLDEWANLFSLDSDHSKYDSATRTQTIVYRIPKPINAVLDDDWKITLGLEVHGPRFSRPQTNINVQTKTCLTLTPPGPRSFETYLEKLRIFSTFISLATQQPVYPLHLRGTIYRPDCNKDGTISSDSVKIIYYVPDLGRPSKELFPPHDMLFVLGDIRDNLAFHVNSWQKAVDTIQSVLDLYFAQLSQAHMYLQHRFLSLIHAMEGYHRRRLDNEDLPQEKHEKRIQEILSSVPSQYERWLKWKLKYSNELSLPKRLSDICRMYDAIMKRISKNKTWIQTAVDIRNDLSHQKEDSKTFSVDQVLTASERLKLLMDLCLLAEAGFSSADIERLIERYWRRNPPLLAIDAKRMMLL